MADKKEKTVVLTKTYTVTLELLDDSTWVMHRSNQGFTPLELLGITHYISLDIQDQMKGNIAPDIVKREVVV